ncbi:GNAT family N-acetyltransferase [Psychrobacillus antarcticus]|uniref:GNAT family N-acetyltransferase n=1 Tax=Psychrobacillus antarcticus TaxID=2879115 RepID=UPI00240851D0|nr:GNAT family N-acetyltransferase [Psychrobacillus antarcticus]
MLEVLNKPTLGLQKKGIYQWDYPWDVNKVVNEINRNYAYVLLLDEEIVGTFCLNVIDCLSELTIDSKSYYLSRIAILPEYQGNNYSSIIMDFAYSFEGNKTIHLDCWTGNY